MMPDQSETNWIEIVRGREIRRVRPWGLEEKIKQGWERVEVGQVVETKPTKIKKRKGATDEVH